VKDSITLHPKKGLNVHLGVCPRCGEGNEVVLLGIRNKKIVCPNCDAVNYGSTRMEACGRCKEPLLNGKAEEIEEWEKIPTGLCAKCGEKQKACDKMVAEGGVYFRCKKCGSRGSIKGDHELAKAVREKMKIPTPGKVGVELDGCPGCEKEGP
jgi:DNA-directed RNA polymerase subunit RPC12/RpoP